MSFFASASCDVFQLRLFLGCAFILRCRVGEMFIKLLGIRTGHQEQVSNSCSVSRISKFVHFYVSSFNIFDSSNWKWLSAEMFHNDAMNIGPEKNGKIL